MALRTQEQLDVIMAGHVVTLADLDALMYNKVKEDSFLEYKHGNEIQDSKAAVYVVSKNAPPLWYQLSLTIHDPLVKFADSGRDRITLANGFLICEWAVDERPVVGWSDLHTYT